MIVPSVSFPALAVLPIKLWKSLTLIICFDWYKLDTIKYLIGRFTPCANVEVHTTQQTNDFFNAYSSAIFIPFGIPAWCPTIPFNAVEYKLVSPKCSFIKFAILKHSVLSDKSLKESREIPLSFSSTNLDNILFTVLFLGQKIAILPFLISLIA